MSSLDFKAPLLYASLAGAAVTLMCIVTEYAMQEDDGAGESDYKTPK